MLSISGSQSRTGSATMYESILVCKKWWDPGDCLFARRLFVSPPSVASPEPNGFARRSASHGPRRTLCRGPPDLRVPTRLSIGLTVYVWAPARLLETGRQGTYRHALKTTLADHYHGKARTAKAVMQRGGIVVAITRKRQGIGMHRARYCTACVLVPAGVRPGLDSKTYTCLTFKQRLMWHPASGWPSHRPAGPPKRPAAGGRGPRSSGSPSEAPCSPSRPPRGDAPRRT